MALYKYVALKDNKELIENVIEAETVKLAREYIRNLGYIPVKVYEESDEQVSIIRQAKSNIRLSLKEKILFTNSLQSMLVSGIPIIEALIILSKNGDNLRIRKIADDIKTKILNGHTFTQALEIYSETFGSVYLKLCKAGEMSGELDKVLFRLVELLKKQSQIKSKLIAASIYPAVIVFILVCLMGVLGNIVFPKLIGFFNANGMDLPLETSILINIIEFLRNYWYMIVIFVCGSCYGFYKLFKVPFIKKEIDAILLNIPVIRDFVRYHSLANFVAVLYVSYESGVPITESIQMARDSIENNVLQKRCDRVVYAIKKGALLSEAVINIDLFPPDLMPMIPIGEKSGRLGSMLKDMSDIIDKKVFETVNNLSTLIGPAFLIILAVFVGFIVLAFYKFYYGMFGIF